MEPAKRPCQDIRLVSRSRAERVLACPSPSTSISQRQVPSAFMISRALFRPAAAQVRRALQTNVSLRPLQRVSSGRFLSYYTDGRVNAFSQVPPRPNTILGKIRYRKDGNPRSKLVGLAFSEQEHFILLRQTRVSSNVLSTVVLFLHRLTDRVQPPHIAHNVRSCRG